MRTPVVLAVATLLLAMTPAAGAAPLVCVASLAPVGTSNGDGTWHFDVTASYLCAAEAEGYLSVTDDFESLFFFETCAELLQCSIHIEGDTWDANCLHLAAFTVAAVHTQNASQQLCAPP